MNKKILAAVIGCVMLCGCVPNGQTSEQSESPKPTEAVKKINTTASPKDTSDFEPMGRYETDITGDGSEDLITLYTSAERSENGEMLWDDTQEWLLSAETENGVYELYSERIHGFAYMNVADFYKETGDEKVVSVYIAGNAVNELREYSFSDNAFNENIAYSTDKTAKEGINSLYSSIPEYR